MSFVNLHVHSSKGSLLDSILTVEQIVQYAVDNNQPAIGLSDHGTMHASLNLVNECTKYGIKPITACEVYECNNHLEQNVEDKYNHLLLIAATTDGLHNLYKIVSEGYLNGFYRKPRISIDWIKENDLGNGIICLTACQAGRLSRYLEQGLQKEAKEFINALCNTFDYVSLELQSHPTESQIACNKLILDFANSVNMNYVITSDAHMKTAQQLDAHGIFVEISQDREVGESYIGCHLQNEDDIYGYLRNDFSDEVIQNGINETINIVNMVDDNIDYELNKGVVMPQAHIPDGYDLDSYFRYLVYKTFDEKFGHMSEEEQQIRRDRIESEIPVLKALDFLNYLLILHEFCTECKKRHIPLGYSRGSAANSLCVFMLDITQIDSVKFDLDFARFANMGRVGSVADIDTDIAKSKRQDAIQVICDLFGADHVAPIATFNTLSTKVCLKDVGKVLNEKESSPYFGQIPYALRDEVAKMIPTVKTLSDLGEEEDKEVLLKELVGKNERLDKIYQQFPLWFEYVMELEGVEKSRGCHASAVLLTPKPIIHYSPLCLDNKKNPISMFDMHICQDTVAGEGLCKLDALGLETLDIIDDTLKNAGLTWEDVDINHLDLEDERVYKEVYSSGNTVGVFQFESYECRTMSIEAQIDDIESVIATNASNRPGTKNSFPEYCRNKLHPEQTQVIHPDLKELFRRTHSILLYQEDSLHLLAYAGFSEAEQDVGRRCVDENTLILMGDGSLKKIKDINIGDYVMSKQDDGTMYASNVLNVFDNGYKDTLKISTENKYELTCTNDHKVLTQRGWIKADDLTTNDFLMTPKKIHADDDGLRGNQKPSDNTMFLLGLLLGDGSLGSDKYIHFTNSEMAVIDKYISCVNELGRSKHECEFTICKQKGVNVDYIYSVYIKSHNYKKILTSMLKKYDMNHKAGTKHIPYQFMSYVATSKIKYLLAGLFNTDGGYNTQSNCIEYYSKSYELCCQIKSLLLKFGIYSYISPKYNNDYQCNYYSIIILHQEALENFETHIIPYMIGRKKEDMTRIINTSKTSENAVNYFLPQEFYDEIYDNHIKYNLSFDYIGNKIGGYKDHGFKLNKNSKLSYNKAKKIIQHVYAPKTYELLMSEYIPVKVSSIVKSNKKHVYDIEVNNTHNYIANFLVVHNCIGKKDMVKMKTLEAQFREGLLQKNWTEQQISDMWELLKKQAEYSFNRG